MNLALWLERSGRSYPTLPAIGYGKSVYSDYATMALRSSKIAGALQAIGISTGDRVGICAKNHPEYLAILFGIWWAGAVAVPINSKLHGNEIAYILDQCEAKACFFTEGVTPFWNGRLIKIESPEYESFISADPVAVAHRANANNAWIFYTSGTTGKPKGAILTHGNLAMMSYAYSAELDPVAVYDSFINSAPLSHGSGLYALPHVMAAATNVIPESASFDADETMELINRWPNPSMYAAPTMINRLVASKVDMQIIKPRGIIWGGAPMHAVDVLKAKQRFPLSLCQLYAQGECPMTVTYLSKREVYDSVFGRLETAGIPYGCTEVKIFDAKDNELPTGEIGEIVCRGPVVMRGYWNDKEASSKALRGGWLHTGDMGSFDSEGYLTLKDRSKDMIISGGSNIYPREVEEVLLQHDKVREVSVIGRPDSEWGESVVAYVVGETTPEELDNLCLSKIARFKRPKHYVFIESLPKNNYGKILKTELRETDKLNHLA